MLKPQIKQDNLRWPMGGFCLISALIYTSPFVGAWLNYIALGLCLYRLVRYDRQIFNVDYCGLICLSIVFSTPSGLSCVVPLVLAAEIWFVFRDGLVIVPSFAVFLSLICYLLMRMQMSINNFLLCVSQLLILYMMVSWEDRQSSILGIKVFISNVIISSIYALIFRNTSPIIRIIGQEVSAFWKSTQTRFQGLYRDPNYYMALIIMSLVLITLLWFYHQLSGRFFLTGTASLLIFGALTYSKTFFFLLCLFWLFCFLHILRKSKWMGLLFIVGTGVLAYILVNTLFATTVFRILSASSIQELTTGRSSLFQIYLAKILSSASSLLFGEGMAAEILELGTHNLYLEVLYYIGLLGFLLYFGFLGMLVFQVQRNAHVQILSRGLFRYLAVIVFCALFCSLQGMYILPVYGLMYMSLISLHIPGTETCQEQIKQHFG